MSIDIFTDESQKRKLNPASNRLKETHEWEMQNLRYINGVHGDYGDDPRDIEFKNRYRVQDELWHDMYYRR